MPYLIIIVGSIIAVLFLFAGAAWLVAVVAALVAVPSIAALRPVYWLLGSGGVAEDVAGLLYIVVHAALGAWLGWWVGRRALGAMGSQPPRPEQDSPRGVSASMPGAQGSAIALPELPWDVRLLNTFRSIYRRLKAYYRLHPQWAWGIGIPLALLFGPLLWPLLLIVAVVLGVLFYRHRGSP